MKVYIAIKAGGGPEDDFRYYLRSSVRNTYVSMVRARRTAPAGDSIEEVIGDDGAEVATLNRFDDSVTARAFLSLPARWQEVLWYTEVEGLSREHTASLLGMNANAVSALAFRAREALRTAWIQQHVGTASDLDKDCEAVTSLLGAHSRRTLPRRDRTRVEQHLGGCTRCTAVAGELADLLTPGKLALLLLPVLIAGGTATAFGSKFAAGSAAAASATTIGAPTAGIAATVGGSGAVSGGAAAFAIVGKVAACALVAGVVIAPAPLLIAASGERAAHSISTQDSHPGESSLSIVDASPGADSEAGPLTHPIVPADPDGSGGDRALPAESGGSASGGADGLGNGNANDQGNGNANANGQSSGTANGAATARAAAPRRATRPVRAAGPPTARAAATRIGAVNGHGEAAPRTVPPRGQRASAGKRCRERPGEGCRERAGRRSGQRRRHSERAGRQRERQPTPTPTPTRQANAQAAGANGDANANPVPTPKRRPMPSATGQANANANEITPTPTPPVSPASPSLRRSERGVPRRCRMNRTRRRPLRR